MGIIHRHRRRIHRSSFYQWGSSSQGDFHSAAVAPFTRAPATLSGWVRPRDIANDSGTMIYVHNSSNNDSYRLKWSPDGSATFWRKDGFSNHLASSGAGLMVDGVWYHIAGVIDPDFEQRLYIDGILVATLAATGTDPDDMQETIIGMTHVGDAANADIAEVSCWGINLTEREIRSIANAAVPESVRFRYCGGLWRPDGNKLALDYSGHGRHLNPDRTATNTSFPNRSGHFPSRLQSGQLQLFQEFGGGEGGGGGGGLVAADVLQLATGQLR